MALYYIKATPTMKLWQATHKQMERLKWGGGEKGVEGGGGDGKGHQCMTMLVMEHGPSNLQKIYVEKIPEAVVSFFDTTTLESLWKKIVELLCCIDFFFYLYLIFVL